MDVRPNSTIIRFIRLVGAKRDEAKLPDTFYVREEDIRALEDLPPWTDSDGRQFKRRTIIQTPYDSYFTEETPEQIKSLFNSEVHFRGLDQPCCRLGK